ncbi:hypothetical protein IW262DRAFT_281975 [Armillaria fumosa]|nr:hypothetical protein IW262DRAFT_281975 [Armillaria fumosa]
MQCYSQRLPVSSSCHPPVVSQPNTFFFFSLRDGGGAVSKTFPGNFWFLLKYIHLDFSAHQAVDMGHDCSKATAACMQQKNTTSPGCDLYCNPCWNISSLFFDSVSTTQQPPSIDFSVLLLAKNKLKSSCMHTLSNDSLFPDHPRVTIYFPFFLFLVLSHLIGVITLMHYRHLITNIDFDKTFMMDNA